MKTEINIFHLLLLVAALFFIYNIYKPKEHFDNIEEKEKNKTCSQVSINENIKAYIFDMKPFYR